MHRGLECLRERRIVIVEDETLVLMQIEDALQDAGCAVVGQAGTVAEALAVVERERPDAVTLDGNLGGELSGPVARRLRELGIPFMVVTGYVDLTQADPHLAPAPRVSKPFTQAGLLKAAVEHLC